MQGYVDYFGRAKILSYEQLLKPKYSPSTSPGVYAWYFDELPPYVSKKGCEVIKTGVLPFRAKWYLLYIGKASNLSERILHEHFDGALVRGKAMSSLRQSLGCLLFNKLKIHLWEYPDFPRREYTFGSKGDKKLTRWIKKHARVAYIRTGHFVNVEHTKELEKKTIIYYTLPLNTENNTHDFLIPLKQLKKDFRNNSFSLDSKNKPKKYFTVIP